MSAHPAADQVLALWREDPNRMVREEFGATPDPWQAKGLKAFAAGAAGGKRRLVFKANKGPGKTTELAWIICNFIACYATKGEHPKGAAVSITHDNINANLWPEIAKWMGRSEFFKREFEWTKTRIQSRRFPETWFFEKRAWAKTADASQQALTLAGLHAKFVLFVLDESGGIPDAVMATAEGALATIGGMKWIVQAGNPTHLEGPLYRACREERHLWEVIEITGDPDDPDRSPRVDIAWAKEQIEKYGRENPWVLVNVFGQFPPSSLNTLLGPDDVEAAKRRYGALRSDTYTWAQKRIGVDVARFGDDRTVIFKRQGLVAFLPDQLRQRDTVAIAGRVAFAINDWIKEDAQPEVLTFVDDSGHWGHGVLDNLKAGGYEVRAVLFEDKQTADPRFANKRAEMWVSMAEWIKKGGCLPPDLPLEMTAELTVPQYTFVGGKFMIEPKDDIKERLGRSPDLADALALTFAMPDMPAQMRKSLAHAPARVTQHEWDPLAGAVS